ncbi:ankyrin repeat-containing domain protein [Aspergillus californicus]
MAVIQDLPRELFYIILEFLRESENNVEFLDLRRVCHAFNAHIQRLIVNIPLSYDALRNDGFSLGMRHHDHVIRSMQTLYLVNKGSVSDPCYRAVTLIRGTVKHLLQTTTAIKQNAVGDNRERFLRASCTLLMRCYVGRYSRLIHGSLYCLRRYKYYYALDEQSTHFLAILVAAYLGDVELLDELLTIQLHRPRAFLVFYLGGPLVIASRGGHIPVVEYLLYKSSDLDNLGLGSPGHEGCYAVHWAARTNNIPMLELLLSKGYGVDDKITHKRRYSLRERLNVLEVAARFGQQAALEFLLAHPNTRKDPESGRRFSLLYHAAVSSNPRLVEWLLRRSDVMITNSDVSRSPLVPAASNTNLKILNLMIKYGKYESRSMFHDACNHCLFESMILDNPELLQIIHDAGVSMNARELEGNSILERAVSSRSIKSIKYMLERDWPGNFSRQRALVSAVVSSDLDCVRLLVEKGNADPNWRNEDGESALSVALDGRPEIAVYLQNINRCL